MGAGGVMVPDSAISFGSGGGSNGREAGCETSSFGRRLSERKRTL